MAGQGGGVTPGEEGESGRGEGGGVDRREERGGGMWTYVVELQTRYNK